jgi:redox-sensitive bicupin YhaK (pirin superfamily)
MIQLRQRQERGQTKIDWLESYHTFSFGDYYDPHHMGFSDLRVINDDRVQAGKGFQTHPHKDMEIVTYVLSGTLAHKDSMGNGSLIHPGDVQRMSAGTGILHSEFNPSDTDPVHFLQIWILPESKGLQPGYEQKSITWEKNAPLTWRLIASRDGRDGSLTVHQDISIYATRLSEGEKLTHTLSPERSYWVQVATGTVLLNDSLMEAGDGFAIPSGTDPIVLEGLGRGSELLLFDLKSA